MAEVEHLYLEWSMIEADGIPGHVVHLLHKEHLPGTWLVVWPKVGAFKLLQELFHFANFF